MAAETRKKARSARPISCFFPADLVTRLEAIGEESRSRGQSHRATQNELRQRMARVMRQLQIRARSAFLLHRSTADPLRQDPLAPFLPALWTRGQLPVRSEDHRVLLRLFVWLQGMSMRLAAVSPEDAAALQTEVTATLTREEEMQAVAALLNQCRASSTRVHRIANRVLESDRLFMEFAVRRATVERRKGMEYTLASMKFAVAEQLQFVLGKEHPYLKIISKLHDQRAKHSSKDEC